MCIIDFGEDMDQFQGALRELVEFQTRNHMSEDPEAPDIDFDDMAKDLHDKGGALMWAGARLLAHSMFAAARFQTIDRTHQDHDAALRSNRLVVQELANGLFMMAVNAIIHDYEAQQAAHDAEG